VETLIKVLLSPIAFAIGFLLPFLAQTIVSAAVAMAFGLMAQLRGSWIWIK